MSLFRAFFKSPCQCTQITLCESCLPLRLVLIVMERTPLHQIKNVKVERKNWRNKKINNSSWLPPSPVPQTRGSGEFQDGIFKGSPKTGLKNTLKKKTYSYCTFKNYFLIFTNKFLARLEYRRGLGPPDEHCGECVTSTHHHQLLNKLHHLLLQGQKVSLSLLLQGQKVSVSLLLQGPKVSLSLLLQGPKVSLSLLLQGQK